VKERVHLDYTEIASIPNNLKVGRSLTLYDTPLSKEYTEEEIIEMIKDKGGSLGVGITFM
jgi:hypothetical protein